MARTFNGSTEKIRTTGGNAAPISGASTRAILCKTAAGRDGAWRNLLSVLDSGGAWSQGYATELDSSNKAVFSPSTSSTTALSTTTTASADGWCLHVFTKAAGSATPRYHRYKYSTGVWVHENMSAAVGDPSIGASPLVEIGGDLGGAGDWFGGDIACAGMFNVVLSDQDVEALAYTLQPWYGSSKGLWPLDQSATGQKVVDLSGGGANESAITGTTIASSSVPVFNYIDGIWLPTIVQPAGGTTFNDSGTGTITLGGTGSHAASFTDSRTGTITIGGTATEAFTHSASASGQVVLSGSGAHSSSAADSRSGAIVLGGTASQSFSHTGSMAGTIVIGGFGSDSYVVGGTVTTPERASMGVGT